MKKITVIFLLLSLLFASCNEFNHKTLTLKKSNKQFYDIFEFEDSVVLKPKDFDIPVCFTILKNRNFLLCDYNKKKVQLLDSNGDYVKDILKDTVDGKLFGSPISVAENTDNGELFVADNSNRRIYILDSSFKFKSSFIISGNHTTPIFMQYFKDNLIMSGHNIFSSEFIHVYSTNGEYKKSYYKSISPIRNNSYINGAGNYVRFEVCNSETFIIEMMNYGITKIDSNLETSSFHNFVAQYFIPLTNEKIKSIKQNFEDIKNTFSKPTFVKCIDNKVMVFSEQPSKSDFEDFFNSRRYILDIFNQSLIPQYNGINIGKMIPIGYYKQDRLIAFITNHDKSVNSFTIKFYKIKN
jgi:hypothetical protein